MGSKIAKQRLAVRALIVAQRRVLLIHTYVPDSGKLIWLTPGGGVEHGEALDQALLREVREETHFTPLHCVGPVWKRRMAFDFHDIRYDQSELFFLVETEPFEPSNAHNPAQQERDIFRGFRWWTLEEIDAATTEIFVPRTLGRHLRALLDNGPPAATIDVGV